MTFDEMLADYCRRCRRPITIPELIECARNNHIIVDDGCFIIYAVFRDQMRILCPYAAKGKSIVPMARKLEAAARQAGIKTISIITDRPRAFERLFRGYRPAGILYEKELI